MTTSLVTSAMQHTSDADFRAWGSQVSTQLAAIGLVKTADTGQIDFTTVTRPTTNVMGGYEIWRLDDALQATRPVVFKLEYGTTVGLLIPGMKITVGTGSNGTGTITGIFVAQKVMGRGVEPTAMPSASYACYSASAGGFFINGWNGSYSTFAPVSTVAFGIWRSCDDDGTPNAEGVSTYAMNGTLTFPDMRSFVASTSTGTTLAYCLVPGLSPTISAFGPDIHVYKHFIATPRVRTIAGLLTYLNAEMAKGAPFTASPHGTAHTYMALGDGVNGMSTANVPHHVLAMLWE